MTNAPQTDEDREDLIVYCGKCFEEALNSGDRGLAYFWLEAQNAQIKLRSAQQVAKLEMERGLV